MHRKFNINSRHSVGNLHIYIYGEFHGMCAWELIKIISRQRPGEGRIFVNTAGINRIEPGGVDLFQTHMTRKSIPTDWLYFKGDKGFKIAPNGSRVLVCKRSRHPIRILSQRPLEIAWKLRRIK